MKVKIGLEVHAGLATESKLFCSCPTSGSSEPNSRVCNVCLGHPGARPVPNSRAIIQALALCMALGSQPADKIIFSRKCYFYPDMPRNYQITQFEKPLGTGGSVTLKSGKKINLKRVHVEEDPASISYEGRMSDAEFSLIDYNRSGCPLVEIVTEPDFEAPSEAREFLNELSKILSYLGVNNPDDTLKADANVSIEETGYVRTEIKNIFGFKDVEQALKFEIVRQKLLHQSEQEARQETRGWDGGKTFHMRMKEEESDYGYIIEPDIPQITIDSEMIEFSKNLVPELGFQKIERYMEEFGLPKEDADVLAADREIAELFDEIVKNQEPKLTARWLRRELRRVLNYNKKNLQDTHLTPSNISEVICLISDDKITEEIGQRIMELLVDESFSPVKYVEQKNLGKVRDSTSLTSIVREVIASNEKAVSDYKNGEEKSLQYLVGQVMKKTKGAADPVMVKNLLWEVLNA